MFEPDVDHCVLINGKLFCKRVPLKLIFPPTEIPPANVEVLVFVTERFVMVVVPRLAELVAMIAPVFILFAKRFVMKEFVVVAF